MNKSYAFITILLVFILKHADSQTGRSCTTPHKKRGTCRSLGECSTMIQFLNDAPKPFTTEVKTLLNKYVCSYENEAINTQICCPSEAIVIGDENQITTPPPLPTGVINHKNIKLLPEECGVIDIGDKIRGGTNATLGEFPWMAILAYRTNDGPKFKCGGSIINDRYILTAAHCIVDTAYPLVSIRVGEYSLLNNTDCDDERPDRCLPKPQDLTIEQTIVHPDYSTSTFANDIALIRVSKIKLDGENVTTVCLPVYEDVLEHDFKSGVVTGWGFTDPYGRNVIDVLQKVELNKRDLSICVEAYKVQAEIKLTHKQLCVGGEGIKDSCGGDSGGPFHVASHFNDDDRYVQRGVVSIGHRFCGTAGFPGVYTNVVYYGKWILDNIKP